jgi:matrixin
VRSRTALDGSSGPPASVAGRAVGDSCRDHHYAFNGLRIFTGRYLYHANRSRMPHRDADRRQVTAGHHAFNDTINDCGLSDVTDVVAAYAGPTKATPHSYPDGVNVVDFGEIANLAGGCGGQAAGVLACTWGQTRDGVYFADIDQRYSTRYLWSDDGAAGRYDVRSVAAHESGHAVGLDHANSSRYLTMYHQIARGETWKRTLAIGDARGLRCRYGVTAGGC